MRTSPSTSDEDALRAETEQRRAAYQARLERDRRLIIGFTGLTAVLGAGIMIALVGTAT